MKTLLIKNVKHLVTCDTDDRVLNGVNVLVQDGIIVWITTMYSQRAIIREFWTPSLQPPTPWASVSMPPEEAWI